VEKVRPWCGQPSDRGRLKNRTEQAKVAPAANEVLGLKSDKQNIFMKNFIATLYAGLGFCLPHLHVTGKAYIRILHSGLESVCC